MAHRYWGVRGSFKGGFYAAPASSGYMASMATITMASSVGGTNLCTTQANAFATSSANSGNLPGNAITGVSGEWTANNTTDTLPIWWYDFGSAVDIVEVKITGGSFTPPAFCLVASDDAVSWTVVQPFGVPVAWAGQTQTFDVVALTVGAHYVWSMRGSSGTTYTQLATIAMASTPGGSDLCSPVPLLSGASSVNGADTPSKALDGNLTTRWTSASGDATPRWFYAFATPQAVQEMRLTVDPTTYAPVGTIGLEWSDDTVTWTRAGSFTPAAWVIDVPQVFTLAPSVSASGMLFAA